MNKETVFYNELQPDQFIDRVKACPIAYLPLGTLEWHSFHMPFGADSLIPKHIFEQIAKNIGGVVLPELFLAPDLNTQKDGKPLFGMEICSFEDDAPQQLPGNAYFVTEEEFSMIIKRILSNLKRNGFKIVVGHGHGPSMNFFRKNQESFFEEFGLKTYTLYDIAYEHEQGIQCDHAAANETSLMMAVDKNLVDLDKLKAAKNLVAVWGENPLTKASVQKGEELFKINAEKASETLKSILAQIESTKADDSQLTMNFTNVKNLVT